MSVIERTESAMPDNVEDPSSERCTRPCVTLGAVKTVRRNVFPRIRLRVEERSKARLLVRHVPSHMEKG